MLLMPALDMVIIREFLLPFVTKVESSAGILTHFSQLLFCYFDIFFITFSDLTTVDVFFFFLSIILIVDVFLVYSSSLYLLWFHIIFFMCTFC